MIWEMGDRDWVVVYERFGFLIPFTKLLEGYVDETVSLEVL